MAKKNVKVTLTAAELEYLIDLVREDYDKACATDIDNENENSNLINQLERYAIFICELKNKLKSCEV